MEKAERKAVVVGGGIIGVVSAIALRRAGFAVTLLERDEIGLGASFGNAGCLNPSSMVPISMPGMLRSVPGWIADPLGPLAVRWSYLPQSLPWLLRYINPGSMHVIRKRASALTDLLAPSLEGNDKLAQEAGLGDIIRRTGVMFAFHSREQFLKDARTWRLRADNGISFTEVQEAALRDVLPQLAPHFTFGIHVPGNGFIRNPHRLLIGLAALFGKAGGKIVRDAAKKIQFEGPDTVSVCMENGAQIPADRIVIAAGAFSKPLLRELGDYLPLDTERGYHIVVSDPEVELPMPVMNVPDKFYATPMETGLRIAGTVEIAGLKRAPDWRRAESLLKLGQRTFPAISARSMDGNVSKWMGHRPSLPDTLPVIGPSSRSRRVIYAFGHGHIGMSAAPMTAACVVALAQDQAPPIDVYRFRPDRFRIGAGNNNP